MTGALVVVLFLAVLVMVVIARSAVVVPQQSAFVVERLGRFRATLGAGFHVLLPFIDVVRYRHSLKETAVDIPEQVCITRDNVQVHVDGVLYLQVLNPERASYGVADYLFAISQLAQTTLRSEVGKIDLEKPKAPRGKKAEAPPAAEVPPAAPPAPAAPPPEPELIKATPQKLAGVKSLGKIELKAMRENNYPDDLSVGVTVVSSTLGPIIPPSINMVIFGSIANVPIGLLFLGGVIPGVIAGMLMMFTFAFLFWRRKVSTLVPQRLPFWRALRDAFVNAAAA